MKDDTVVALRQPESFSDDPLTEILRAGARQLLGQAIEAEVAAHIEAHADLTDASGRRRIVRHGHMPEREVQTGIGAVTVKRPRVRDRDPQATGGRIRFTSSILPPYLRRAKSVEALLPWLYLKGISSGDFSEALAALLGPDAPGLTASTIGRLKAVWWDEYEAGQKRDLSARRYVYFWADGVYFSPRMDHDKQCVLVIIGADAMGNMDKLRMRWARHRWHDDRGKQVSIALMVPATPSETTSRGSPRPRRRMSWKKALTVSASSLEPAIRCSGTLAPPMVKPQAARTGSRFCPGRMRSAQTRPVAFNRPLQEGLHLAVDLLAHPADLVLGDAGHPHHLHQLVDRAR